MQANGHGDGDFGGNDLAPCAEDEWQTLDKAMDKSILLENPVKAKSKGE